MTYVSLALKNASLHLSFAIFREKVRTETGREAGLGHTGEICGLVRSGQYPDRYIQAEFK